MAKQLFNDALRTLYGPAKTDHFGERRDAAGDEHHEIDPAPRSFGGFTDMDDFDSAPVKAPYRGDDYVPAPRSLAQDLATLKPAQAGDVECPKCKGKGYIMLGWRNPYRADCFKCASTGKITRRQAGAIQAKVTRANNVAEWQKTHAAEIAWLRAATWMDIAQQIVADIDGNGTVSDARMAKVEEWMRKDAERKAARAAQRAAEAPAMECSGILKALQTAVANKLKWPRLILDGFNFTLAKASGVNAGAVYVKTGRGDNSTYLGKIVDGKFLASRDCSQDLIPRITAAAADPAGAAKQYGLETGECSCCGRELTNKLSIELGIGPICRERFGF